MKFVIFFVIVLTPVLIAGWELFRTRKDPKPALVDPWGVFFGRRESE